MFSNFIITYYATCIAIVTVLYIQSYLRHFGYIARATAENGVKIGLFMQLAGPIIATIKHDGVRNLKGRYAQT